MFKRLNFLSIFALSNKKIYTLVYINFHMASNR